MTGGYVQAVRGPIPPQVQEAMQDCMKQGLPKEPPVLQDLQRLDRQVIELHGVISHLGERLGGCLCPGGEPVGAPSAPQQQGSPLHNALLSLSDQIATAMERLTIMSSRLEV